MFWNFLATHPVVMLTVGGALGTNARYFLGRWVMGYTGSAGFPWWTFLINVSGSFLLGVFAALWVEHQPEAGRRPYLFLGVGFCGGYTTFSSFEYEILQRTRGGQWGQAAAYVIASLLVGFAAVALGAWLGSRMVGGND
jgi:CrcB protein